MNASKSSIFSRLQTDMLALQGLRKPSPADAIDLGLGPLNNAFPHKTFPLSAVHEFISAGPESKAATAGFISALLGGLMQTGGAAIWISCTRTIFPPALSMFGIEPERIIFLDLKNEKEVLWAMEEALRCNGLAAVVGEIPELSFTVSRRFQLAVEKSRVTGFIHRSNPRNIQSNACLARWKIKSLPSLSYNGLPGLGFPRWEVELLKIRNGVPGLWQMEWEASRFKYLPAILTSILTEEKRKTG